MRRDVGAVEAGKLADLVVLDQNPLQEIRHTDTIRYLMKDGETLGQIWPRPKKREIDDGPRMRRIGQISTD